MSNKSNIRKSPKRQRFDLNDVEPMQLDAIDTADDDDNVEIEQIHVFSIGDVDYFMPTEVPYFHSVRVMEINATRGESAAIAYMLRATLGDESYEALINYPKLRSEHFEQIVTTANKIIMASRGKAKLQSGSSRSAG
jgi:hypothetical protein